MENQDNANPYAASATVAQVTLETGSELAGRGRRLAAAIIDGLILGLLVWVPAFFMFNISPQGMAAMGMGVTMILSLSGVLLYLLVNGYHLHKNGQTLGKKMLDIRIVRMDGSLAGLPHIFLRRALPVHIISAIPVINMLGIVDALFIFGEQHRCVHDLIADTKVVYC